jgi:hypothetical protein
MSRGRVSNAELLRVRLRSHQYDVCPLLAQLPGPVTDGGRWTVVTDSAVWKSG